MIRNKKDLAECIYRPCESFTGITVLKWQCNIIHSRDEALNKLGVLEKFHGAVYRSLSYLVNKRFTKEVSRVNQINAYFEYLERSTTFSDFIARSFQLSMSAEGSAYWYRIIDEAGKMKG